MEYLIFVAAMVCLVLLFVVKEAFDARKKEKKFIHRLYEEYGVLPQREYKQEQFDGISHYYLKHMDGFCIDDITWNDLNMDEIFKSMNYTFSAAGEEYLYYTLRKPCQEEEELRHREEIIDYFRSNPRERVAFQCIYNRLGRTGKFSIYDYLDYLDALGERSNLSHYLSILLVLVSAGLLFVNISAGIFGLVGVFIYNNITYFKIKNDIDPYLTSFAYIFRLLGGVKELQSHSIPVLLEEIEELKSCSSAMGRFKIGSSLLMMPSRMNGAGSPLDMLLDFFRMTFHLDLIKFNQMLSQVRKHISQIDRMLTIVGMVEAMIAVGAYREALKIYTIPKLDEGCELEAKGLYHPLIRDPVPNDINAKRSVLVTGSNASGKSTFLKTVAVNAILAQTIHTCLAESYQGAFFRICSSMSLKDDVQGGESYYMAEIRALKRILDLMREDGAPVLCFVDEVLRGTNTVERIAASTQILLSMSTQRCICFAATHDIELTHLLENVYDNYHFSEEIADQDISFSYKLLQGRASSRNAIRLLKIMGYEEEIVKEAERRAQRFMETGEWRRLDSVQ